MTVIVNNGWSIPHIGHRHQEQCSWRQIQSILMLLNIHSLIYSVYIHSFQMMYRQLLCEQPPCPYFSFASTSLKKRNAPQMRTGKKGQRRSWAFPTGSHLILILIPSYTCLLHIDCICLSFLHCAFLNVSHREHGTVTNLYHRPTREKNTTVTILSGKPSS